uniref:Putative secreted protein n=1 Tax=Anopheles darlingi TaxID=43151 RepID=A0A2M4DFX8_ANODA
MMMGDAVCCVLLSVCDSRSVGIVTLDSHLSIEQTQTHKRTQGRQPDPGVGGSSVNNLISLTRYLIK